MPLDFDIMLGSSPPILSQSPIFSYFNSLATARAAAAAYGHYEDKKASSGPRNWVAAMQSSNGYNKNHNQNNNNNNINNHFHHNQSNGKTGGGFNNGYRTQSLPPTLFSRPVLNASSLLVPPPSSSSSSPSSLSSAPLSKRRPTLDAPLRPCIIVRDLPLLAAAPEQQPGTTQSEPTSPTRLKKRVVFADDKGLDLTQVRVMKEPSSCPPRWSPDFLDLVLRVSGAEAPEAPVWEVTFPQPAANYKEFREHLESDNVALENVIVKAESEEVSGTVKVRNVGFHKEVLVRWTADSWKTYEDVHCTYLPSGAEGTAVVNVFDTFRFCFKVPKAGKLGKDGQPLCRIDFCVCFRAESGEFWDNNKGRNFSLEAPTPKPPPPPPPPAAPVPSRVSIVSQNDGGFLPTSSSRGGVGNGKSARNLSKSYLKTADALRAEVPSWSEFASWNHLTNDAPYW